MEQIKLAALVSNYRPALDTLDRLKKVRLLMLVGPSGVGKTTIIRASGFAEVISDASRAPRKVDKHGVDNWYRCEVEMLREIEAGLY